MSDDFWGRLRDEKLERIAEELEKQEWDPIADRILAATAKMEKKRFDHLVRAGFTEEQAIQIVAHQGCKIN